MATPCVIVTGVYGLPVMESELGAPMTPQENDAPVKNLGIPVVVVLDRGTPVKFINEDGTDWEA